jgi:hypothetical protein
VHALRASSVGSDLTFESIPDAIISQTEKIYGRPFSGDLIDALQRASTNASTSLAGSRQSSMSSSTSMDISLSSQSDWTVNDEVELTGLLGEEQEGTSQVQPQPSSGAQHSAPTVATIKLLGPSILLGVGKIYPKKIPLELSYVLTRSTALPNAMNTDEEIDTILVECEEITGKRLPADLVVALREASVTTRSPNSSTRSRRSRLSRQASGSFRSSSRSSGMPSIQESANGDFEEPLRNEHDDTGKSTITSTYSTKDQQDSLGKEPAEKNSRKQLSVYVPPAPGTNIDRSDDNLEPIYPPTSPLKRTQSDKSEYSEYSEYSEDVSISMDEAQALKSKSQDLGESAGCNSSTSTALMSNIADDKSSSTTEKKKKSWAPMLAPEPRPASPVRSDSNHSGGSDGSANRKKEAAPRSSSSSTEITSGSAGNRPESRIPLTPAMKEKLGTIKTASPAGIESDDLNDIFKEAARRFSR